MSAYHIHPVPARIQEIEIADWVIDNESFQSSSPCRNLDPFAGGGGWYSARSWDGVLGRDLGRTGKSEGLQGSFENPGSSWESFEGERDARGEEAKSAPAEGG